MLVWPADDRGAPVEADASGPINPFSAFDCGGGWRLADNRSPIGTGASRSVNPFGTHDSVGLLGKSECTKCNHEGEHNPFHF